jgi:hypothetical protein
LNSIISKHNQRFLAFLLALVLMLQLSVFQTNAYTVDYTLPENELYSLDLNGPPDVTSGSEFTNIDGEDQISMTEARSFEAMIPVEMTTEQAETAISDEDFKWTLSRTEPYLDEELYPYYQKGGDLTSWKDSSKESKNLFENITTSVVEEEDTVYIKLTFKNNPYYPDLSIPQGSASSAMDYIGWYKLAATNKTSILGSAAVKIVPYDSFHTMGEVYNEIKDMIDYESDLYVKELSMGKSTLGYDMPYVIIAKDEQAVNNWLDLCERTETEPDKVLAELDNGTLNDYQVPVIYTNIHSNETSSTDAIMNFAWMLLKNDSIDYDMLTDFTAEGEARLVEQMGPEGQEGSIAIPDLIKDKATYLGFLTTAGSGIGTSAEVDIDKYYEKETNTVEVSELLDDIFFILVPEENVEGRIFMSRTATGGFDLNRDNSFQTQSETKNMQQMIGKYNPVSLTELHGRVTAFQCEPCDPPHEPNFEYDLLSRYLMTGGEAFGIAAIANNDSYNSYVIPMRDYLEYTGTGNETMWQDPWDDMSTSYTPQFAMLHGCASYTVEQPAYNDSTVQACSYGQLGQAYYVATNKEGYFKAQLEIYDRGLKNFNSNEYDLVGQWFADQEDTEGSEMELFRPEYNEEDENGNFYPECYIIPLDRYNQKNMDAAYDMMEWLTRNDVKVQISQKSFDYDGVTYPKGTMVIPMYQAKRSVANGALYNGTLITTWSVLYSEGITAFNKTRGFDMATCAKPDDYDVIEAACGEMMDYEDSLAYISIAAKSTLDNGITGYQVIISNVSEDSTAAVNTLLKNGKTVGMITEGDNRGNFICSYENWLTVKDDFILTGTCISKNYPTSKVITKNPVIYINGKPSSKTSGYVNYSLVTSTNYNYDRQSIDLMNFETTADITKADIIVGTSALDTDALTAVKAGKPYIGYGSSATNDTILNNFFNDITRISVSEGSMDALAYVIYPEENLINSSYVVEDDDILYGYGAGFFNNVPEGADTLVCIDSERKPLEGFLCSKDVDSNSNIEDFLNSSIQAFSYNGKDNEDNDINVAFFANSLTQKVHQRDEFAYISNFAFSNVLGDDYTALEVQMASTRIAADTFDDIEETDWYADSVASMMNLNLMVGISPTNFAPQSLFDRCMMATVLYRLAGEPTVTGSSPFKDVESETWYHNAVIWGSANNIINGYGNENFGPIDPITREQVVTILYRYAINTGLNVSEANGNSDFKDNNQVSDYASTAMNWAITNGIVNGNTEGMLNPKSTATRAEVAAIMVRAIELFQ